MADGQALMWVERDMVVDGVRVHFLSAGGGATPSPHASVDARASRSEATHPSQRDPQVNPGQVSPELHVMLHGFLVDHRAWKPACDEAWRVLASETEIATRQRFVLLDLPGSGQSEKRSPEGFSYELADMARWVEAFIATQLQEMGDGAASARVHLWGHSMGGAIALLVGARRPAWLASLHVVNPASFSPPVPWKGKAALVPAIGPWLFRTVYRYPVFLDYFRQQSFSGTLPEGAEARIRSYYERFSQPGGRRAAYAQFRALTDMPDHFEDYRRIDVPVEVLWGDNDRIFPASTLLRLQKALPEVQVQRFAGHPHALVEEAPQIIAEALVARMRDVSAVAGKDASGGSR